ncbi:Na+/H+ antiporter [Foetidibacter luteolus]|uniref:Na+/H+ antiporter n=1 Tax=Foetidibacter luteolus TaxID=2608880 RepID=UPI00129B4CBF|nr:Na+/H+ antiporter [Foetidibacter luteolus]
MLENKLLLVLVLLLAVSMLSMLSQKLRISYPIFLVLAGLAISLLPDVPHVTLEPEVVFIVFLPPLLYAAAWNTSWAEFWRFRRAISLLAFGLVIFTSAVIAFTAHAIIPGFPLELGFLLGGIISPPDAVAATSVLQELKVPKRVVTILEGESLVNDASSLIVFSFAVAAVQTGEFELSKAIGSFTWLVLLGIAIGLVIGNIMYAIHRYLPTTPSIDTAITIIAPYLMYITAEHFHVSGVLAVVSGGLFLSFRSSDIFSYSTRLQTQSVWDTLVFLLNGVVFILIGLQLPEVVGGLWDYSLSEAVLYAVIISLVTIAVRLAWVFPGTYLPRLLSKKIRLREQRPGWKPVFIVGWSGMRGVVSLASALAVPLVVSEGGPAFPHRNLILFITFVVILFTLVLQGLSLPWFIKLFNIKVRDNEEEQEQSLQIALATAAINYIDTNCGEQAAEEEAFRQLRFRYQRLIDAASEKLLEQDAERPNTNSFLTFRRLLLELIEVRRNELKKFHKNHTYPHELIRRKEEDLDLEEARLRK